MANVTFTVPNKNGSYDGDTVVREYDSVTINSGDTVTVDQPCRGLVIYCKGDMTINGTLHMNLKGAAANPTSAGGSDSNVVSSAGIKFGFFDGSSSDSLTVANTLYNGMGNDARSVLSNAPSGSGTNYKVHTIPRTSTNGASRPSVSSNGTMENPADIRGGNASSSGAYFGGGGAGHTSSGGAGGSSSGTITNGGSSYGVGNETGSNGGSGLFGRGRSTTQSQSGEPEVKYWRGRRIEEKPAPGDRGKIIEFGSPDDDKS